METKYVREFITLAELENYVAAAEELYISQPSLTKHIKTLETELGVQLFDRTTRKVRLSRFGRAFLPFAQRIAEADSDAGEALAKLARDVSDTLHLGVLPSFISYHAMDYLTAFKSRYSNYSVTLREGSNDDLLRWVTEGKCNLAIVRHPGDDPGPQFCVLPLVRDALVVAVPRGHPFDDGKRTSVRVEELEGMELIMSTSPTEDRMLQSLSTRTGVQFQIASRLGRSDSIVKMLEQGYGPALLMKIPTLHTYGDKVRVLDLEPAAMTTISLVYLKHEPLNSAARSFIKIVFPNGTEGGPAYG